MEPEAYDSVAIGRSLDAHGNAVLPGLLTAEQCDDLGAIYLPEEGYRTRIVMARHEFWRGECKYFAYTLPQLLEHLRHAVYLWLAPIANRWDMQLGIGVQYPSGLTIFLRRCHEAGQAWPTPLILQHGEGGYNCLRQDLYGDDVCTLQIALLLLESGQSFAGGEFAMAEFSRKGQRADVVPVCEGDAVVFTVNQWPAMGRRGNRKVAMRHGASRARSGKRRTMGLIFHGAR